MPALTLSANINQTIPGVAFNDIYLDSFGNISTSTGQEALLQQCAQAASTRLGEEFLNTNVGIPYFEAAFVGVPHIEQINAALRSAWLAIGGVVEVLSLITTQVGNTLQYTAIIRTTDGTGGLSGSI